MKAALLTFLVEMNKLRTFLESSGAEEQFYSIVEELDAAFVEKHGPIITAMTKDVTNKRRYGYFISIISMYGALERFVESAVQDYAGELVGQCASYNDLPEKTRKRHSDLSIEYLWLLKEGRMKDGEDTQTIIDRMASCVDGATSFELNAKAFTLRSGNMNIERVQLIFSNAGIDLALKSLACSNGFRERYNKIYGSDPDLTSDSSIRRIFSRVDDLVVIRNRIAHGIIDVDEIEEMSLVIERLVDLENFIRALVESMEQEFLLFCCQKGKLIKLGPVIQIFNNEIVCFEHNNGEVSVGNMIAMPTNDPMEPIRFGEVISIEVEHVAVDTVAAACGLNVGMKVPFRAKINTDYYLVPSDISSVLQGGP